MVCEGPYHWRFMFVTNGRLTHLQNQFDINGSPAGWDNPKVYFKKIDDSACRSGSYSSGSSSDTSSGQGSGQQGGQVSSAAVAQASSQPATQASPPPQSNVGGSSTPGTCNQNDKGTDTSNGASVTCGGDHQWYGLNGIVPATQVTVVSSGQQQQSQSQPQ